MFCLLYVLPTLWHYFDGIWQSQKVVDYQLTLVLLLHLAKHTGSAAAWLGREFVFVFLGCMIHLHVGVCFVLPWTVESFPFMLWRWRNKLKWAPFELVAPSPLSRVRSWFHPFKAHCEQKAMRDEGIIYVAGYPLLNRRCTSLPGCFYFPKRKL